MFLKNRFQYMPVLTGPGCLTNEACPVTAFPSRISTCVVEFSEGGVNDLYFIPCTETMSEANVLDTEWWQGLVDDEKIGIVGLGLGSIAKKSDKREKVSSCRPEQITSITWALKYIIKAIDKTSADITTSQLNTLLSKFPSYLVIARMCEGDDTVLPIGAFSVSDLNWTVPESNEDVQTTEFELSWKEFGKPKTYTVAGLSAILPKA